MTEPTTPDASRRSRPMILAAAAVAAVILAGGIALAVSGGSDDDLPVLDLGAAPAGPMAAGGDERSAESDAMTDDMAAGASRMLWARYEAADELPDLGGSAPVYRMVAGDDDLRAIAEHLGVQGEVTDADGGRAITDGTAAVTGSGASWWYTSGEPYPGEGDRAVSSGCVSPDAPEGAEPAQVDCPEPEPMPEPERPADLPSQAEAEGIIRAVAEAAGLDLAGAQITSYDNITTWGVNIELALDGTVIPGWSVYGTVMSGGRVLDAGGAMGRLEEIGDYPLDTTRAAIDRMNAQTDEQMAGAGEPTDDVARDDVGQTEPGVAEPMPAEEAPQTDPAAPPADGGGVSGSPGAGSSTDTGGTEPAPPPDEMTIMPVQPGEPIVVTLRSGELSYSLMGNADGTQTYLVPTYLLDGEDANGQPWEDVYFPAVRADLLGV